MKTINKNAGLLFGFVSILAAPVIVYGATTIQSPTAACFQGGSTVIFSWSIDPSANHAYASVWQGSSQPTYLTAPGNNITAGTPSHFAAGPVSWPAPNSTSSTPYQLYVESHDGGHNNINTALSTPFNTDASPPGTPSISPGGTSDTTATIAWTTPADLGCEGIRGYNIFRNSTQIATVTSGNTYEDTGLTPNTAYGYKVQAYDNFVTSGDSTTITLTTKPTNTQSNNTPTTTSTTNGTTNEIAPSPGGAAQINELNLTAPKIDVPDTSKIPKAESPDRLNTVKVDTTPSDIKSPSFYIIATVFALLLGGVVFVIVNRFAPKL